MKSENLSEIPEEIKEYLSMAAEGDVEALASATWWALINGKESLGVQWFEEFSDKITPSDTAEVTEFEVSRRANVVSNYCFLKLAIDFSDNEAIEALDAAAQWSPEAAFAPVLISSRNGNQEWAQVILKSLSRECVEIVKGVYSGVCSTAQENGNLDSWFVNWAKDALEILESLPPSIDPSTPNPSQVSPDLKMVSIKSIYLGGAAVHFADAHNVETGEDIDNRIEAFLGFDCWAHVSKLILDGITVGLAVIPYGPVFGNADIVGVLEAAENGAEIPLGAFLTEELIEAGAFAVGNITSTSKILVSGYSLGSPTDESDSDLVLDCAGDFTLAIFTTDTSFCDGLVALLDKDLAESLGKYIRTA